MTEANKDSFNFEDMKNCMSVSIKDDKFLLDKNQENINPSNIKPSPKNKKQEEDVNLRICRSYSVPSNFLPFNFVPTIKPKKNREEIKPLSEFAISEKVYFSDDEKKKRNKNYAIKVIDKQTLNRSNSGKKCKVSFNNFFKRKTKTVKIRKNISNNNQNNGEGLILSRKNKRPTILMGLIKKNNK